MIYPSSPFFMDRHRVPARTYVSVRLSVLPSVFHHGKLVLARKKEKKSAKTFVETSKLFPQSFILENDNIRKNNHKKKIHRRAKSKQRNVSANFPKTTTRFLVREIDLWKIKSNSLSNVLSLTFRNKKKWKQDYFSLWYFDIKKKINDTAVLELLR